MPLILARIRAASQGAGCGAKSALACAVVWVGARAHGSENDLSSVGKRARRRDGSGTSELAHSSLACAATPTEGLVETSAMLHAPCAIPPRIHAHMRATTAEAYVLKRVDRK